MSLKKAEKLKYRLMLVKLLIKWLKKHSQLEIKYRQNQLLRLSLKRRFQLRKNMNRREISSRRRKMKMKKKFLRKKLKKRVNKKSQKLQKARLQKYWIK